MTAASATLRELAHRLGKGVHVGLPDEGRHELALPTGEAALDRRIGGVPRGRITEIVGPASAGKASLLLRLLERTVAPDVRDGAGEAAALLDPSRSIFPAGRWARGRLLVVRPSRLDDALKALDVLLGCAALAVLAIHLPADATRRLPEAVRVRSARLARETGTAVVACCQSTTFGTYAALRLELQPARDGAIDIAVTKNRSGWLGTVRSDRSTWTPPAPSSPPLRPEPLLRLL
jgi:hypothetical protein